MTDIGAFTSTNEFIRSFKSHVSDLINNRSSNTKYINDKTNEQRMKKLKQDLDKWVKEYVSQKNKGKSWVPSQYDVHDFWEKLDGCYSRKLNWQEWNDKKYGPVIFPVGHPKHIEKKAKNQPPESSEYLGYSDFLESSTLLTQKSLIQHRYSKKPPCVKWNLTEIKQGGKTAYIGDAIINQIDAVSSVPWLDAGNSSEWFANRAGNPAKLQDEWQRVVSIDRIRNIERFANEKENSMFNPVTLFVDLEDPNISLTKIKRRHAGKDRYELEVRFDFLQEDEGSDSLTDYLPEPHAKDHRPVWVVDGQHRIRGYSLSYRGFEYRIPIVVLVSDPDSPDRGRRSVAKIFTEINTLGEEIEEKHQYFLKYRFGIQRSKSDDFSIEPGTRTKTSLGEPSKNSDSKSRTNRRAYELALHLAKTQDSALYDSICFLHNGRSIPVSTIFDIKYWMGEIPSWFDVKGIYSESKTDKFVFEEVNNYYLAFCEMANRRDWPCGHEKKKSGWPDKNPRWNIPVNREGTLKPLCQQSGGFIAITEILPHLVRKMMSENESRKRPISKKEFRQFLEDTSISEIDWRKKELKDQLGGRGGPNVTTLKNFMITCIDEKVKHDHEDVMSDNIYSIPGKGILSVPDKREIRFDTKVKWPASSGVELKMEKPFHSNSPDWKAVAYDKDKSDPIQFDLEKKWIKQGMALNPDGKETTHSFLRFDIEDVLEAFPNEEIVKIKVTGFWKNKCGNGAASEITLEED